MQPSLAPTAPPSTEVIEQLGSVCQRRGLPDLADRLVALQRWIAGDLATLEDDLTALARDPARVCRAAYHLLDLGGKHLRPMCVALAARTGTGFGPGARRLAVAVELVHTATLLHDDVIDLGDARRGHPTARMVYGNATSIFAGDWLLVAALREIRAAGVPGTLDPMLEIIDEMIRAESLQLDNRGRVDLDASQYLEIVTGKTAALFRWAMIAGARAGQASQATCDALERFGLHLGIAFQVVDDLLDYGGSDLTGKTLFADLREGKMTYPLVVALEREPSLRPLLAEALAQGGDGATPALATIATAVEETGALARSRELAAHHIARAIACLEAVPAGPARIALTTVAEATAHRER